MNKLFILACICIIIVSCHSNKSTDEIADIQCNGDTVYVAENSIINSKIKLYTVAEQSYSAELNTTGVVKAISGQLAEIAPPFNGRISKSFVRIGQKVNAGTPIFELHSSEFFEATKNYFQSLQTKKMKELNFHRQKDLVKNGVGVVKDLEEAEADYEVALKDYENAGATMKMFNVNPDEMTMGQALKVVSPIAGEVVQTNMVIGQYVKNDAEPLAIVADLAKVWVIARVKEKDINAVRSDDKVEIRTEADPEQIITGYVSHISELLDEETRSVQVSVACDNQDRKLKPGMFTSVHFINPPKPSVLIPATALLQTEEDTYVFIQENNGKFVKRKVETTTANHREALITKGLNPGDAVVTEGGIYLKVN